MGSVSFSYTGEGGTIAGATASWTTGSSTITVTIDYGLSKIMGWKIKGRASLGDTKTYIDAGSGESTGTFTQTSTSKSYVFQVNEGGNMVNSGDGIFTIDFNASSGGDDDDDEDWEEDEGGGSSGSTCMLVILRNGGYSWDYFPETTTLYKYNYTDLYLPQPYKNPVSTSIPFTITGYANGGDYNTSLTAEKVTTTSYPFTGWTDEEGRLWTNTYDIFEYGVLNAGQSYNTSQSYVDNTLGKLTKPTKSNINETYIITYNGNGGTSSKSSDVVNKNITYDFAYWCSNSDGTGTRYTDSSTFTTNTDVYAIWNTNDISNSTILLPTATREGYTFMGWGIGPSSEVILTGSYTPESSVTLYAQWAARDDIKYKINHYLEPIYDHDDYILHSSYDRTANSDEKIVLYNLQSSFKGFTYDHGTADNVNVEEVIVSNDGSLVINLYYTRNSYSLTLLESDNVFSVTGAGTYKYEETVQIEAEFDLVYHLVNWTGSSLNITDNPATFTMPATSLTLTPNVKPNTYRIQFDKNDDNATGYTPMMTMTYGVSADLNLNEYVNSGYAFVGWNTKPNGTGTAYTDGQSVKNISIDHNSTVTLYAQWGANKYNVIYISNGATNVPSTGIKEYGKNYTISTQIPVKTGYSFIGWSTTNSEDNVDYKSGDTYTKNEQLTLYAIWSIKSSTNTINHILIGFNNGEGNYNNGTQYLVKSDTFTCEYNEKFVLNDTNKLDNIPNGFKLNTSFEYIKSGSSGTTYFNMGDTITQIDSAMIFNFYYAPIDYKINYNLNGGSNNSKNPETYNVLYGVNLQNPNKTGSKFTGWTNNNGDPITNINGNTLLFTNTEELYSTLISRDIGSISIDANWEILGGGITIPGINGKYQCFIYRNGEWKLVAPYMIKDGAWEPY